VTSDTLLTPPHLIISRHQAVLRRRLKILSGDYKSHAEEEFASIRIGACSVRSDNVPKPFGAKTLHNTPGD